MADGAPRIAKWAPAGAGSMRVATYTPVALSYSDETATAVPAVIDAAPPGKPSSAVPETTRTGWPSTARRPPAVSYAVVTGPTRSTCTVIFVAFAALSV